MNKKIILFIMLLLLPLLLAGCGVNRDLPEIVMPKPPNSCGLVMSYKPKAYPKGKTKGAAYFKYLARENTRNVRLHEQSKVCSKYALSLYKLRDKDLTSTPTYKKHGN